MAAIPQWAGDEDAPFWEGVERGELRMQICARCARLRFPPRPVCPYCHSLEAIWRPMSGRGTLWSFVIAHPPLVAPFQELAPYNVVVVALEEDATIRMVGNLLAMPGGAINQVPADRIRIGARVKAVFNDAGGGPRLPRWIYI
jgi:uncharacterized protein